jgi:hypothetical protein
MVVARTLLSVAAQGLAILGFSLAHHPDPAGAAVAWWSVYDTLVDIGCLALLFVFLRREGLRIWDLVGFDRRRLLRDVLLGLGIIAVLFPLVMIGGSILVSLLVYGTLQPDLPAGTFGRVLPLWGVLYSRMVWWVIWSFTEELTYQGYALPRLQAMTKRTVPVVLLIALFWSLQHCFLPFFPDARKFLFTFLEFVPIAIAMQLIYLRIRRLPALLVAHWGMDLILSIMSIA